MKGIDLIELCKGTKIPIEFTEQIEELEIRFEEGMRAYLVGANEDDDMVTLNVEEDDFAEYNKSIERPLWLDKDSREYNLRFSETNNNHWNGKQTLFDNTGELCGNFKILENSKIRLFELYQVDHIREDTSLSYIEWLEEIAVDVVLQ